MQPSIYEIHHQKAFAVAKAMDAVALHQVNNLLGQLLQTGASFSEANTELRHLFSQISATG